MYAWGRDEYKHIAVAPEITNHRPAAGAHKLDANRVELQTTLTGWFDNDFICLIAEQGIDLEADLPPGLRPQIT